MAPLVCACARAGHFVNFFSAEVKELEGKDEASLWLEDLSALRDAVAKEIRHRYAALCLL